MSRTGGGGHFKQDRQVRNPANPSEILTKAKEDPKFDALVKQIGETLEHLKVLDTANCSMADARAGEERPLIQYPCRNLEDFLPGGVYRRLSRPSFSVIYRHDGSGSRRSCGDALRPGNPDLHRTGVEDDIGTFVRDKRLTSGTRCRVQGSRMQYEGSTPASR